MTYIGVDLVHIPAFAEQLARPGSTFESVFSATELRVAAGKPERATHLAGRWAAKEAFIKAWSQALYGRPPVMGPDQVPWQELEVRPDRWGRVMMEPRGAVARAVHDSLGEIHSALSISHDGDYATASCLITLQHPRLSSS
ncbi:Holo-[acyl-carrier-protein] synthase [Corynebacterium occultum]|uniref:Holo-[acyl-carrier-protein] synthase n=1 Tax=Corynebacterium occultum TaxID=2675219 RepID=A0A6B8VVH5_9CORY|nr:holo-ACP synthase [Corynebacterium occultum]QGU08143.1 Holo-[acyl-carrier-protein] synthase [Corynebacterium occultum]